MEVGCISWWDWPAGHSPGPHQPQVTRKHNLSPSLHPRSGKLISLRDQRRWNISFLEIFPTKVRDVDSIPDDDDGQYPEFFPNSFSFVPCVYLSWPVATPRQLETWADILQMTKVEEAKCRIQLPKNLNPKYSWRQIIIVIKIFIFINPIPALSNMSFNHKLPQLKTWQAVNTVFQTNSCWVNDPWRKLGSTWTLSPIFSNITSFPKLFLICNLQWRVQRSKR